jgi:hypothetical protein
MKSRHAVRAAIFRIGKHHALFCHPGTTRNNLHFYCAAEDQAIPRREQDNRKGRCRRRFDMAWMIPYPIRVALSLEDHPLAAPMAFAALLIEGAIPQLFDANTKRGHR